MLAEYPIKAINKIQAMYIGKISINILFFKIILWPKSLPTLYVSDKISSNLFLVKINEATESIKLNENQLKELKTNILSKNLTSEEDVQKHIKNKWNEEYTLAGVRNLLKTQFNIDLNENVNTIKELTTKLQKHLKELENSDVEDDDEINKIKFLISREQNAEVFKKLVYLLFRRLGFSNRFSSSLLSITTATGNNWLNKWEKIGYEGLKRKKGQGRKCKLTNEQLETLKKN